MPSTWLIRIAIFLALACRPGARAELPPYYAQVLSDTVGFLGGATADPDGAYVLGPRAALALEQQLKRVTGADEARDLNLTEVRALPDAALYRLLTLAAVGNFTSARASGWQQPASVSVVPETGLFVLSNPGDSSDEALRVLLLIMCAVMFKRWMEDEARAQAAESAAKTQPEPKAAEPKSE